VGWLNYPAAVADLPQDFGDRVAMTRNDDDWGPKPMVDGQVAIHQFS